MLREHRGEHTSDNVSKFSPVTKFPRSRLPASQAPAPQLLGCLCSGGQSLHPLRRRPSIPFFVMIGTISNAVAGLACQSAAAPGMADDKRVFDTDVGTAKDLFLGTIERDKSMVRCKTVIANLSNHLDVRGCARNADEDREATPPLLPLLGCLRQHAEDAGQYRRRPGLEIPAVHSERLHEFLIRAMAKGSTLWENSPVPRYPILSGADKIGITFVENHHKKQTPLH